MSRTNAERDAFGKRETELMAELSEAHADCIRLQQEINCLRMEPCQLPKCVELQEWAKRVEGPANAPHEPTTTMNRRIRIMGLERENIRLEAQLAASNAKVERLTKALNEIRWYVSVAVSRDGAREGYARIDGLVQEAIASDEGDTK